MPRPKKFRCLGFQPGVTYFKPRDIPLSVLKEVILTFDELESLRLVDYRNMTQIDAAKKMKISQSTLQRILTSARSKTSEALASGKAIKIEGGVFKMAQQNRKFKCTKCGHEWQEPFGTGERGVEMSCSKCGSKLVHRIDYDGHGFGRRARSFRCRGAK